MNIWVYSKTSQFRKRRKRSQIKNVASENAASENVASENVACPISTQLPIMTLEFTMLAEELYKNHKILWKHSNYGLER